MDFTIVAYITAAAFIVAALLMFGTKSGLVPSSFPAGKLFPVLVGILLLGFVGHNYGPQLFGQWSSMFESATGVSSLSPRLTVPAGAVIAPHPVPEPAPHAKPKQAASAVHWKTIIVDPTTLPAPPTEPRPVSEDWSAASVAPDQPDGTPAANNPPETPEPPADTSHHPGRLKRAFHHVGRFLHITHGDN